MTRPALTPQDVTQLNAKFETAPPADIIRWAVETFHPHAALTSSFGTDSAALLHMAVQVEPAISVRTVDTGFLFPETLQHMERLKRLLRLHMTVFRTTLDDATIAKLTRQHATAPIDDRYCCGQYKREAMERALAGVTCWMTGLMREEAVSRRATPIVEVLSNGITKVAPIAAWSAKQIHAYMQEHHLPYHPLWAQGYTSIGCALHTQKPVDPNDPRSGRWAGTGKTECGIHDIGKPAKPTPGAG